MKKLLLFSALFVFAMSIQAQTNKKNVLINGQIGFTTRSYPNSSAYSGGTEYTQTSFSLNPRFGYFLANNIVTGVSLNLGIDNAITRYNNTLYETDGVKSLQLGVGGFTRLYINISENFKFFTQGGMDFQHSKRKSNFPNGYGMLESTEDRLYMNIVPGFVYFIRPKIGIEATIGEIYYDQSLTTKGYHRSGAEANLNTLRLGFSLYL